jgi:hypothetical protein
LSTISGRYGQFQKNWSKNRLTLLYRVVIIILCIFAATSPSGVVHVYIHFRPGY